MFFYWENLHLISFKVVFFLKPVNNSCSWLLLFQLILILERKLSCQHSIYFLGLRIKIDCYWAFIFALNYHPFLLHTIDWEIMFIRKSPHLLIFHLRKLFSSLLLHRGLSFWDILNISTDHHHKDSSSIVKDLLVVEGVSLCLNACLFPTLTPRFILVQSNLQ